MTCQASRAPKSHARSAGVARTQPQDRRRRVDLGAGALGVAALDAPRLVRADPDGQVAAVHLEVDRGVSRERALARRKGQRSGLLPAGTGRQRPEPGTEEAAGDQAEGRGHDEPAQEIETGPAQDQADPDPDEDERPEGPQAADLVAGQVPGTEGEGDRARQDQEDTPAKEPATDVHGATVPDAHPRGVQAFEPLDPP